MPEVSVAYPEYARCVADNTPEKHGGAVSYDAIPKELRALPQWLVWRLECREGQPKPTKVPYDWRSGRKASTTDRSTWTTFEHATRARETSVTVANAGYCRKRFSDNGEYSAHFSLENGVPGGFAGYADKMAEMGKPYAGVGFVFTDRDPYCGVDLDGAYEAPGCLFPWADSLLGGLATYAERSPSGTGVHAIARADVGGGARRGAIEVYDRGRYFTMTGEHVTGTPDTIADAQRALDDLLLSIRPKTPYTDVPVWGYGDTGGDLRARASEGRVRRDTLALLDSTGGDRYGSASEADAALAAGLAHAGLTADEMLALLDGSPRGQDGYRRKGRHHGKYYWRVTVENAVRFVGPVLVSGGRRVQMGGAR